MPCFDPRKGWRSKDRNPSGKRGIVFNRAYALVDQPVTIPCGQCIGCRLERSRIWAIRCVHEASLHESNCFITLTYSPENLPADGSLKVKHFQDFMKRLRKRYSDRKIRFFHCGEYGERGGRPHYHALLFNFDFPDKVYDRKTPQGHPVFVSKALEELWPLGISEIGSVTFESAAYVARYITKKVTGPRAEEHYTTIDRVTGEILAERSPEYVTMSRRPGIGRDWYEKFKSDVYPSDSLVVDRGDKMVQVNPPKFYNSLFEKEQPEEYAKIKARRQVDAKDHVENQTWDRLKVREEIQLAKMDQLERKYEHED